MRKLGQGTKAVVDPRAGPDNPDLDGKRLLHPTMLLSIAGTSVHPNRIRADGQPLTRGLADEKTQHTGCEGRTVGHGCTQDCLEMAGVAARDQRFLKCSSAAANCSFHSRNRQPTWVGYSGYTGPSSFLDHRYTHEPQSTHRGRPLIGECRDSMWSTASSAVPGSS